MGEWYTAVRQPTWPWTGPCRCAWGVSCSSGRDIGYFTWLLLLIYVDDINVKGGETVDEGRREKKV